MVRSGDFFQLMYSCRSVGSMFLSESPEPPSVVSESARPREGEEGAESDWSAVALWWDWARLRCLLGWLGVEVITRAFRADTSVSRPSTCKLVSAVSVKILDLYEHSVIQSLLSEHAKS